jgi:hypothetical protein
MKRRIRRKKRKWRGKLLEEGENREENQNKKRRMGNED